MTRNASASIGTVHTYYEHFLNHYKRPIVVAYGLHIIDSSETERHAKVSVYVSVR
jgi:hypothetical protein